MKIHRLKLPNSLAGPAHCTPTLSRTQAPQLVWQHSQSVRLALTCLEMMSFPRGMGAPFSVAILFKVAMAFSWFPDSTSYLALSGSHYGDRTPRCGQLWRNRTLGPSHTLSPVCEVLKAKGSGARSLASSPSTTIDYNGFVTLSNNLTSLCLYFLIHQMGTIIDPSS